MKVVGIIAEFNPFHNGHKYLIDRCKRDLGADYVVIVMSGDFVQRGAPAIISKFSRAKMALTSGADAVFELPVYYSLGSAEFFAQGAISLLSGLGAVTDIAFGSEFKDLDKLSKIADILIEEPIAYKEVMQKALSEGASYPSAQAKGLCAELKASGRVSEEADNADENDLLHEYMDIFTCPNSGLAVEYLKALKRKDSPIKPHVIQRMGASYHDTAIINSDAPSASATGIRKLIIGSKTSTLTGGLITDAMPMEAFNELTGYRGVFLSENSFSELLNYKLLLEKNEGYEQYMDVTYDLSNRISAFLDDYKDFSSFTALVNSKNLTYTRISRSLMHILLNITQDNMDAYKADGFTNYGRILGIKKASSGLLAEIHENATIPVLDRLKDADKVLFPLQRQLFNETLAASSIYNSLAQNGIKTEFSLKQIII